MDRTWWTRRISVVRWLNGFYAKHDGFHAKNGGFYAKHDGFHAKNDGFHAKNDGLIEALNELHMAMTPLELSLLLEAIGKDLKIKMINTEFLYCT